MTDDAPHYVLLDDQVTGRQLYFSDPKTIIHAQNISELPAAFAAIESALERGYYIAGYLSYELGYALEPSLHHLLNILDAPQTLLKLGVFAPPSDCPPAALLYSRDMPEIKLEPSWSQADYEARFTRLKYYIERGDCYQVNLTFPMQGTVHNRKEGYEGSDDESEQSTKTVSPKKVSLEKLFAAFRQNQPGRYGALLRLDDSAIISFSPELFFERSALKDNIEGNDDEMIAPNMRMRPMKGTRPRSQNADDNQDKAIAAAMRAEPKSQAENLMIVDLLRNDLARLSKAGSVTVPELFTLETYPTLHQMTSQVSAQLRAGLSWQDIFKGLFPCGSVTGAPKIRAMEIIHELETRPRGAYCGSIGFIAPDHSACFNVAIRTAILQDQQLSYNVGSGVVYDSGGADEYRECLLKANILRPKPEQVFETFKRDSDGKFIRLDAHLNRLKSACSLKSWPFPETDIQAALDTIRSQYAGRALHVRLALTQRDRGISVDIDHKIYHDKALPLSIALSRYALDPKWQETRFKTAHRQFYDGERARIQALYRHTQNQSQKASHNSETGPSEIMDMDIDEVIFADNHGFICEGSYTAIFLKQDGRLYTPAPSDNILPSIFTAHMIKTAQAQPKPITMEDLKNADEIYCGNSLRGLMPAVLASKDRL